jgi:hypothetical protein
MRCFHPFCTTVIGVLPSNEHTLRVKFPVVVDKRRDDSTRWSFWYELNLTEQCSRTCTVLNSIIATNVPSDLTKRLLDDQHNHESFWRKMGEDVEEILIEVDRMIALADGRGATSITQYRAYFFRQTEFDEPNKTPFTSTVGWPGQTRESVELRKPQDKDAYWSVSSTAWLRTSNSRRTVLSHVGRINETSEGEEATDCDCTRCARSGAECMVYRHEVRIQSGDIARRACSRCIFRGLKCSFNTTGTNSGNKGKAATRGMGKFKQSQRTSSERRLRSSGTA